jgi:hypothetical protein
VVGRGLALVEETHLVEKLEEPEEVTRPVLELEEIQGGPRAVSPTPSMDRSRPHSERLVQSRRL